MRIPMLRLSNGIPNKEKKKLKKRLDCYHAEQSQWKLVAFHVKQCAL